MAMIPGRNPIIPNPGAYPAAFAPTMSGYQMPGYYPTMQPAMQQPVAYQQPGQVQQAAPAAGTQMSLPTVHAEILQVENLQAMERQPVDAGTSQMMISKDETIIGVKSMLANGEYTLDIYEKRKPEPKPPAPEYVTREEFERRLSEALRAAEDARRSAEVPAWKPEPEEEPEPAAYEQPEPVRKPVTRTTGGAKRR